MKNSKELGLPVWLNLSSIILIFIIDVFFPIDDNIWLLYILPVLWTRFEKLNKTTVIITSAAATVFIFLELFINNQTPLQGSMLFNKSLFTLLLWILALLQIHRGELYVKMKSNLEKIKLSEAARLESQQRYTSLFNNKTMGIVHARIITDTNGKPFDYEFINVNETYSILTGAKNVIGKTVRTVYPGVENFPDNYIEKYGKVALGGGDLSFETFSPVTNTWYSVYAYSPKQGEFTLIFSDISKRKNAEEEIREKTKNLQEAQHLAHIGSWKWDMATGITTGSEELFRIYGLDPGSEYFPSFNELKGNQLPEEDWEILNNAVEKSVQTGIGYELDLRALRNGNIIWITTRSEIITDPEGKVTGLRGTVQDITERKLSGEARRKVEERLRNTLDSMMEGCAILDQNWNYVYVNEANARHAHLSVDEMTGCNMLELIPGVEDSKFFKAYECCMKERTPQNIEASFTFADGTKAWFEVKVQPVPEGIFLLSADITERKRTERSLKKALQQLKFHVENSPLAVVEFDPQYRITQWAGNAEKIFGWKAEEVMGKRIEDFKWVYEEDVERVARLGKEMLASNKTSNLHTNRNYRKDGSVITCEWYNSALVNPDGSLVSVFSLVLDITERNNAMLELRQTTEMLERSNKELEQFAYVASHDLQEPLRMVSNYTQLFARKYKGSLDNKADTYIDFIIEGAKRMYALINDLLAYSRVANKEEDFRKIDLNDVLEDVLTDLKMTIKENKAFVKSGKLPVLNADCTQIRQVFQNLVANALKFKAAECPEITIDAFEKDNKYIFYVKDNGIGIEPQYFDRIFVIFQRLHDRSTYAGTGIGLSICKRIIERHGGTMWVESEPGRGSTFYFSLPKA